MANYAVILKIGFKLPEYFYLFYPPAFLQSFARRKKSLNFSPNWLGVNILTFSSTLVGEKLLKIGLWGRIT